MPEEAEKTIQAHDLAGWKKLRQVAGLLSHLHEAGCGRDKAGNRELHFDDYVLLILLYLFNPLIDSMRTLQKVAELPEVQERLGIKRFSLGSFSESCRVFDPAMLHQKRGKGKRRGVGQTGPTSDGTLRIVTDLLDVPAHVIAFLYEYRWTIEVFFRFLKQILGCRHLLSTKQQGVQIQIYAAVICCLLFNTLTGKKPTKWMVTLMALYLDGLASDDDVLRELNRPNNTGVKLRARDELWKTLGY